MAQHTNSRIVFAEERKQKILELLSENKKIVVPELCNFFGVSASTIRNDLRDLKKANLITRTHGGAISNTNTVQEYLPSEKGTLMYKQKAAIGKVAAGLVDDGDTIAISTGTTSLELAKNIVGKKDLTVVVNDIHIAAYLEENSNITLFMMGGILRSRFHYVNTTHDMMPRINIDKMFFSCNSLSIDIGATVPDYQLSSAIREIMRRSAQKVLLCDSSKLGSVSFAQVASMSDIDTIVIDNGPGIDELKGSSAQDWPNIIVAE